MSNGLHGLQVLRRCAAVNIKESPGLSFSNMIVKRFTQGVPGYALRIFYEPMTITCVAL